MTSFENLDVGVAVLYHGLSALPLPHQHQPIGPHHRGSRGKKTSLYFTHCPIQSNRNAVSFFLFHLQFHTFFSDHLYIFTFYIKEGLIYFFLGPRGPLVLPPMGPARPR